MVGLFIASGVIDIPIQVACLLLSIAAVAGNLTGYWIGYRAGPAAVQPAGLPVLPPGVRRQDPLASSTSTAPGRSCWPGSCRSCARSSRPWPGSGGWTCAPTRCTRRSVASCGPPGVTLLGYYLGNIPFVKDHIELILIGIVGAVDHPDRDRDLPAPPRGRGGAAAAVEPAVLTPAQRAARRAASGSRAAGPRVVAVTDAREQLLDQIRTKAVVHGRVVLSSGREADYYVDLRRVTLDGHAAPLVGEVMLDLTADLSYDAVGGLTLGRRPGGHRDAARRRGPRPAPGRLRGPQGGEGPRPAAAHRGPGRRRPAGAGRRGHLDDRRAR